MITAWLSVETQNVLYIESTKSIGGETRGHGCTRRHAQGARGRRDQAKACQDQRKQRKARVASAVLLMRRREREGGRNEEEEREGGGNRENMAEATRGGINKGKMKELIFIWSKSENIETALTEESHSCGFIYVEVFVCLVCFSVTPFKRCIPKGFLIGWS